MIVAVASNENCMLCIASWLFNYLHSDEHPTAAVVAVAVFEFGKGKHAANKHKAEVYTHEM